MEETDIHLADEREREIAARLLADSEPWITLGIDIGQCRKICFDSELLVYIANIGNKPAGVLILDPRGVAGSPYIKSIAVYPEFRNKGTGTELISFAETLFTGKSKHIFICVSSFNDGAQRLYERNGYKKAGEFEDYIVDGASEILMHKRI